MALVIEVSVVPSSGRQQCILDKSGNGLKCYLKSAPERGQANEELIKILSKALKVPQGTITIMAGATSRKKLLSIKHAITFEAVLAALGIERQMKI